MITQSRVYTDYHRTEFKFVNNLGWLLKHWKGVKEFRVYTQGLTNHSDDAILVAEMLDGKIYETGFACKDVLKDFLQRPVFYSLGCTWDSKFYIIERR